MRKWKWKAEVIEMIRVHQLKALSFIYGAYNTNEAAFIQLAESIQRKALWFNVVQISKHASLRRLPAICVVSKRIKST